MYNLRSCRHGFVSGQQLIQLVRGCCKSPFWPSLSETLSRTLSRIGSFSSVSDKVFKPRLSPQALVNLPNGPFQYRLLHVKPILGLIENGLGVRLEGFLVNFIAAICRQTMH